MRIIRVCRFTVLIGGLLLSAHAHAQNLSTFVNNSANGATAAQIATGNAVQSACSRLAMEGNFGLPTGPVLDLFLRCNEMVQTAQALQDDPANPSPRLRNTGLSGPELLAAVQNLAGEELFSQSTMSTRASNGQFSNISGRLNAVRLGGTSAGTGGRVAFSDPYGDPNRDTPGYNQVSLSSNSLNGGGAAGDLAGSRWGWFVEGSFNTGDRDQTDAEDGFDFDATSVTLGLDYMLESGVVGVSVGIDNYEADLEINSTVNGGTVDVESSTGSLFAAFYSGNWYFDGIVSFGGLDSDTTRQAFYTPVNICVPACPIQDDTLQGTTDGEFLSAGATIGYDANRGNWSITTSLSLSYRDIDIDGYSETDPAGGGLTLAFADQTVESLKSVLGISFNGAFSRSFGVLGPLFRAEYHHEFQDDPQSLVAKYSVEELLANQGLPGAAGPGVFSLNNSVCFSCFQILGDEVDTDFGLLGVGLSAVFSQRIQLYGVFDVLVGADHLSSNTFSVGLRGQF